MECGSVCDSDGEPATFYDTKDIKARKRHKCCECGGKIEPGQVYKYVIGIWDGDLSTFKTCLVCSRIARDFCCEHGSLREHLWDVLGFDYVTGKLADHWDDAAGAAGKEK